MDDMRDFAGVCLVEKIALRRPIDDIDVDRLRNQLFYRMTFEDRG